jgi:hypothetical protein
MWRVGPTGLLLALAIAAGAAGAAGSACATPPDREMQQAEDAIASARAAGAHEYAAVDLAAAEEALVRARDAVALADYRLALSHALDGRERAQAAEAEAGRARAAAQAEAERTIARLDAALVAARTRLDSTRGSGASPEAGGAGAEVVTHAAARLQEARAAAARGDFRAALQLAADALSAVDPAERRPAGPSSRLSGSGAPGRI